MFGVDENGVRDSAAKRQIERQHQLSPSCHVTAANKPRQQLNGPDNAGRYLLARTAAPQDQIAKHRQIVIGGYRRTARGQRELGKTIDSSRGRR